MKRKFNHSNLKKISHNKQLSFTKKFSRKRKYSPTHSEANIILTTKPNTIRKGNNMSVSLLNIGTKL